MIVESNRPSAVNYALIVFVMLTLIFGSLAFINHREASDVRAQVADRNQELLAIRAKDFSLLTELDLGEQVLKKLSKVKEGFEADLQTKNQRIVELEKIVEQQKERIDELSKGRVEVADGQIVRVDNASKVVWINLGEADFLRPRMTFQVYRKENQGAGRGAEEMKGKIEVTRILAPHLSEARIVNEDLQRPIVKNDLIDTPVWKPGQLGKVSVIGWIDLDGDGRSDLEEFKKILAITGAEINDQVDEQGNRISETARIAAQTNFLILGTIPDPETIADENDKAIAVKIQKHLTDMIDEAKSSGVRVIRIDDFLANEVEFRTQRKPRPVLQF